MKKILLIEDNEHIMAINAEYLHLKGYEIEQAGTVKRAEEVLSVYKPDLIVMDIMLPDGDGVDLCEKIKAASGIPILFLTAKSADRDIITGLKRGGDDYMTKPYDLDVLEARIDALLRQRTQAIEQLQNFNLGPLRFDVVMSRAYVNDEELNLSGNEFGILFYLAQHNGKTVSKELLCQAVWGQDSASAILWTTVSRLKKKIAGYEELFYIDSDHSGYELVMIPDRRSRKAEIK